MLLDFHVKLIWAYAHDMLKMCTIDGSRLNAEVAKWAILLVDAV